MPDSVETSAGAVDAPEPPVLAPDEIAAERARGKLAGYFALAAVPLMIASIVIRLSDFPAKDVDNESSLLLTVDEHATSWIATNLLKAVAVALMAPLLLHLVLAARQRIPTVPRFIQTLALLGPLLVAIALPLQQVFLLDLAHDFAAGANHSLKEAEDALKDGAFQVTIGLNLAGTVALGFAFVMTGLYTMRAGLLTRFQGAIGIIIGFVTVVPIIGAAEILQAFWLMAVALLLIGPDERKPPAWPAGRAIPWPKMGQVRGAAGEPDAEPEGDLKPTDKPAPE